MTVRLHVLGSGSKGNAFALSAGPDALLVEAGFGGRTLAKRATAAGLELDSIRAILLTHEHGDHARGAAPLARRLAIPVVCSPGTWQALGAPADVEHVPLRATRDLDLGIAIAHPFPTTHDAAEPLALAIEFGGARVAFGTDMGRSTAGVRYLLRDAHGIVLESNYDEVMLRTGGYPIGVQERIASSRGHLSNRMSAELLAEACHADLGVVVLAHLSEQCNNPERALATVEPALRARGFRGRLLVAPQAAPLPPISVRGAAVRDQGELALRWDAATVAPRG